MNLVYVNGKRVYIVAQLIEGDVPKTSHQRQERSLCIVSNYGRLWAKVDSNAPLRNVILCRVNVSRANVNG
jgi:hypothetical protein